MKTKKHFYLIFILILCMAFSPTVISYAETVHCNEWVTKGNKTYYYKNDGTLAKYWKKLNVSTSAEAEYKWCYFNKKGVFIKSVPLDTNNKWKKVDGKRYYFVNDHKPILDGIPFYNYKYETYILVDISDQSFKYYKKGKIVQKGRVITGKPKTPTPRGVFKINCKGTNVRLKGKDKDDEWDHIVKKWMAFKGNAFGFHDAVWQSDWYFRDKTAYKTHGSHGCINMRLNDVKKLFKKVKVGTYVIIRK